MVQMITGKKGKGKTKILLDKCNEAVQTAVGSIVYLDKSAKHMYELNNKVRLINVEEYDVDSYDGFIGFICGIISQDHDLEQMYFDSFLKIAHLEPADIVKAAAQLEKIGKEYQITFVLNVSADEADLPAEAKPYIVVSL